MTLQVRHRYFSFFRIRFLSNLAASAVLLATALLPFGPNLQLMTALAVAKWMDSLLDILYASLQHRSRIMEMAIAMSVNGVLILTFFWILFEWTGSLSLSILGSAAGSALISVFVAREVLPFERRADSILAPGGTCGILKAGVPSGVAQSVNSLVSYLPILLLSVWASPAQAGIFTAVTYFFTLANLIMSALVQAVLPQLVAKMNSGQAVFSATLSRIGILFVGLGTTLGIGTLLFGDRLLVLVYGPDFVIPFAVLLPTALGLALLPLVYVTSLTLLVTNHYVAQVRIAIHSLLLAVGFSIFLLRDFGIAQAAWLVVFGIAVRSGLGLLEMKSRRSNSTEIVR